MATKPPKKYTKRELSDWFTKKARSATAIRKNIMNRHDRASGFADIGRMYFFWYDPKHKATLPIYDKFPLVFPIEEYNDGFLGLNIHYLDYEERIALLSKLTRYAEDKSLPPRTKLALSYATLNRARGISSLIRPCIKRYLWGHFRSHLVEINADEWDKASQLGVELFVTKSIRKKK